MLSRRRIARTLAALMAITLIQTVSGIQAPSSYAAAGNVGSTTASGTCVSAVGETTYVNATFVNNAFCLLQVTSGTTWTVPVGVNTIDILVVGGGGGAGSDGGGGGGGGEVRTATGIAVSGSATVTTTVGAGGTGGSWVNSRPPTSGGTSSVVIGATTYSAGGGGSGVGWQSTLTNASRGSGGTNGTAVTGGTNYSLGGQNAWGTPSQGGTGYDGVSTSFTGTSMYFAGGGGGGQCTNTVGDATFGGLAGGLGGGGRGSRHTQNVGSDAGVQGTDTLGGGGGAGSACNDGGTNGTNARMDGGRGGNGVVYIKFVPVPAVSANPTSATAVIGNTATFSAATQGTIAGATRTVKWQVLVPAGSWTDISGATNDTYVTPAATRSMNGNQYRYVTTDTVGTISSTSYSTAATLSVTSPYQSETDTALSLNGSSQYADVADTSGSPFDTTGTFTIEAWVNPADACPVAGAIVAKLSYMLYCNSGNWYVMALANGSTGSGVSTGISVQANEWHHIAATKTSTSGDILFYYDGVLVKTVASGATTMTANNTAFQIGHWDNYTYYFKGQIDEVRFYNSQRSATQVAADMKTYGSVSDSDLMAYYDFNEGTGTTLYNRKTGAAAGTDLTITGSPTWSDIKITDTTTLPAYTIVKFPRSYLTVNGGWKVPANIPKVSALIIAGGGGGGARAAGGGGAGGLVYRTVLTLTSGTIETITVGQGGLGGYSVPAFTNRQGLNGQDSQMGTHTVALGGGGGGGAGDAGNTYRVGLNGGSGGGASGDAAGNGSSAAYGYGQQNSSKGYGSGSNGGSGVSGSYWNGGGGGGSGGAGSNSSTTSWVAGNGGAGTLDPVGGSNLCLAAGGGGGTVNTGTSAGAGGTCGSGTVTAGAGTIGAVVAGSATANSGSGGGGSGYNTTDVGGGQGGSGVIIVRWITAAKPSFTKPTNAYLNVGMTETFTTNVSSDSATVNLTRTFRWESSTTGINGTYSLIKQGTGATNAVLAWVPTDTTTSGSTFAYRVIVTDSDSAGLFIVDTSTPVWAVINKSLLVTGSGSIGKAINVARNETFTIQFGTPTFRPTLAPVIPGISIDTSTAGYAVIKIAETITVGTYYETLTVIDSVSASVVTPLTITVAAPPSLTATADLVDSSTVLYLDAGNSASLLPNTSTTWKDMSGRNLQVNFPPTSYPVGTTSCTAPTYSPNYMGILNFATDNCGYAPNVGSANLTYPYTYQTWIKRNGSMGTGSIDGDYTSIVATPWTSGRQVGLTLHWRHVLNSADYYLEAAVWGNPTWYAAQWTTPIPVDTWVFVTVTFTGTAISISVNNQTAVTATVSTTIDKANIDTGLIFGKRFDQGAGYYLNGSIATFRMYSRILSLSEISQNYEATKSRFLATGIDARYPSQKYGSLGYETYTVTSGYGTRTSTFSVGDRAGIDWDTSTVINQIKLSLQDSLTVGAYNDTVTVTDALGQSSYLPISMTVTKADTITVTVNSFTPLTYTGLQANITPTLTITGLKSANSVGSNPATISYSGASNVLGTCASGGACAIGDTGPGGGIVFYDAGSQQSWGRFLEVAKAGWGGSGETTSRWCSSAMGNTALNVITDGIGQGLANSTTIANSCGEGAAYLARTYSGGGKTNWYVPTPAEFVLMYNSRSYLDLATSTLIWLSVEANDANMSWVGRVAALSSSGAGGNNKNDVLTVRPIRAFAAGDTTTTYSTIIPTDADTYTVRASGLALTSGSLSNYQGVTYVDATLRINRAQQSPLLINQFNAVFGTPYKVVISGGSGTGAITETVTAGTASGCSISGDTVTSTTVGTCNLTATKARDKNYETATATAYIYFLVWVSPATATNSTGSTMGLTGATSITLDPNQAPTILSLSVSSGRVGDTVIITGAGFTASTLQSVKFWRNILATVTGTTTNSQITVIVPAGATTGKILVTTANGLAITEGSFTVLP